MELLPLGPVVIIDTAGFDDEGDLGELRIKKTEEILGRTDIAILVADATLGLTDKDLELQKLFEARKLPYIIVFNKSDLPHEHIEGKFYTSALKGENINELKEKIASLAPKLEPERFIIADKLKKGDVVILVTPIDEAAPKGRLILPQQNTLRELLDFHCVPICTQVEELPALLNKIMPALVITDSQAFGKVKEIVPKEIPLTSFSILFARYKGNLDKLISGAKLLKNLKDGDIILISEGCTHHRQCNDIGSVKLPKWIEEFSRAKLNFEFTSGGEFPSDTSKYALVVHCGGCMLNPQEMQTRLNRTEKIVNYGVAIAYMNGILPRTLEILGVEL